MNVIPTRVHGVLDYVVSLLLIAALWLLGFARGGAETYVPVALGIGSTLYSLFTNYELGMVRSIPMRTHLMLDMASGALLAASPWLFGFADYIYLPHVIIGLMEIAIAAMTEREPARGGMAGGRTRVVG